MVSIADVEDAHVKATLEALPEIEDGLAQLSRCAVRQATASFAYIGYFQIKVMQLAAKRRKRPAKGA